MIIDQVEQLKDWLTTSLAPICEAEPGALAKYVVALVKKDKPFQELKDSCAEQLHVFLQGKTKEFVETLFEVLENKSYITEKSESERTPTQDEKTGDETPIVSESTGDVTSVQIADTLPTSSDQQLVTSTSKSELKKDEDLREAFPIDKRRKSRSISPRPSKSREEERGFDKRRLGYNRNFQRRRSISPRYRGRRSRSPYRRRSPYRPARRSRSPLPRGRGRGRSWSRSRSRSPRRSPRGSRSRSRERRSPGGRIIATGSPGRFRSRSRSPYRPWSPRGRSPFRRSMSPYYRSRSPRRRSRSRSLSAKRSRSGTPPRKVRRQSPDSRGPTPTQENGLADSTIPTPSNSAISVVSQTRKPRCRDYDEKGFCVRGDLCPYDHGVDPVVVENVGQYPGPPPPGPGRHMARPPPPPGHINLGIPPPGFFPPNRAPQIHVRPDFHQEPYNPEAPAIARPPNMPPYWPGGPEGMPPFMSGPPIPSRTIEQRLPVHARLGNRDLINLTVKKEVKDEPEEEDEDSPSTSVRTVIAPKDDSPLVAPEQPLPPGVPGSQPLPPKAPAPGPAAPPRFGQHQRFHPYHRFSGPWKTFDYNRVGGFRKPDQTNCSLEVRKIPAEFNNIAKINEHFGKFGTLTNIQVKFEGDQEAALVTYSNNGEALACYKCADPVFNNRFIKVFWHNKNKENTSQDQSTVSTTTQAAQDDLSKLSKPRVIPHPSQLQLNNLTKKSTAETTPSTETEQTTTTASVSAENTVTYTSSMGTISKTVYNSAAHKAKLAAQQSISSPTAVKAADFVSRMEKVKQMEAMKKEASLKKLELQKHKHELLEKQIEQQKKLIATLEKNKDMKESSKKAVMETLKTLTKSIDKLKKELGTNMFPCPGTSAKPGMKSPEQAKKEILDVELELMTKSTSGEDTADLQKKLDELTKVANSMGLLGRGRARGRGVVARGRAATTWVASGLAPTPAAVGRGARGRGARGGRAAMMAARTLDRRPKVVEVGGFEAEEKDEVEAHLNALKGVENLEMKEGTTPSAIITFITRKDAEQGILQGSKFKTKTLKMNWYIPKPDFTRSASTTSVDTDDQEIDEEALLAGVDDEEEEDGEERSWRP